MDNIIITRHNGHIISALCEDGRIAEFSADPDDDRVRVGDIYLAMLKDIRPNTGGAFAQIGQNKVYLNLEYGGSEKTGSRTMKSGDIFPVRIIKEGGAKKSAAASCDLSIPGRLVVATSNMGCISVSRKIHEKERRDSLSAILKPISEDCGFIIRTNAKDAKDSQIIREAEQLSLRLHCINTRALHGMPGEKLYSAMPFWQEMIYSVQNGKEVGVVTDDEKIFNELAALKNASDDDFMPIRFYEDKLLPLANLYGLWGIMDDILKKTIWLKSGAYIVIEHTEAMTVIDVNSGKCDKKGGRQKTEKNINIEAAKEIAFQLRLRNISGIIIVDFISLDGTHDMDEVVIELKEALKKDGANPTFVDVTPLGLAEITRKRTRRPAAAQIRGMLDADVRP